jgi:type VI secretion system protein VasG
MADISRIALFGKLNTLAYKAIESATVFCKLRGNPYVELVHWFHQILQQPGGSDIHSIVRAFELDPAKLARDMTAALDRLPRGAASISDLSLHIEDATERAWSWATLKFGEAHIRTGHVVVAMLKTPGLKNSLSAMSREFDGVKADRLVEEFAKITAGSPEAVLAASDGSQLTSQAVPGEFSGAMPAAQRGKQEALQRFTVDLTEQARRGQIDPVVGRDAEVRQIVDILMRRRQNNPILTGEAGVGKTAVAEGFARRIVAGDVPPALREVSLRALDIGLLQAGASMKGEFEQRLRQVIDEVQSSPKPIVLFIDEVHTLIGAGGATGTGDAANLLKPALARGSLRTIGATTWAEYKKYIEKDPALTRRFQPVKIDEPTEEAAVLMMRAVASSMEKHHRVEVLDEALHAAVRLAARYIPERQLPDKSISLLDTACARVAVSQHAMPAEVENCQRCIEALTTELEIVGREAAVGLENAERRAKVSTDLAGQKRELQVLQTAWHDEKMLVDEILALRARLRVASHSVGEYEGGDSRSTAPATAPPETISPPMAAAERTEAFNRLQQLQADLAAIQGERPLILPSVDEQAIASVVADWTGIPLGRMVKDEIQSVLNLDQAISQRVVGQAHALQTIARRVQTARAHLENPNKPVGVFMLVGPSGVGKTETALALAEALYGGEQNMVTINMSEFQEAHTVSTLKGSPPGYVGYGEGGVLTEAVRRRPYSVVLLDEVEKAHRDVHEIFFQVFDKGVMEDSEGRRVDFRNTLIILTSNVGTELIGGLCKDPQRLPAPQDVAEALRTALLEVFPAALLGRLIVIPYFPLSDDTLGKIIRLQMDRVVARTKQNHSVHLYYHPAVIELIASRCTEPESGGRMIDAILTNTLLPQISRELLQRISMAVPTTSIWVGVKDGEFVCRFQ